MVKQHVTPPIDTPTGNGWQWPISATPPRTTATSTCTRKMLSSTAIPAANPDSRAWSSSTTPPSGAPFRTPPSRLWTSSKRPQAANSPAASCCVARTMDRSWDPRHRPEDRTAWHRDPAVRGPKMRGTLDYGGIAGSPGADRGLSSRRLIQGNSQLRSAARTRGSEASSSAGQNGKSGGAINKASSTPSAANSSAVLFLYSTNFRCSRQTY